MDRIPISPGFFIEFSADGRALSRGRAEAAVLPWVLYWLERHPNDKSRPAVERWVQEKEKQIEADREEQEIRLKRREINALIDRVARETRLDPELREMARAATFEARGVPQFE